NPGARMNHPSLPWSGAREGIRTPGLPITNRLRYHCATRARRPSSHSGTPDGDGGQNGHARNKNSPPPWRGYAPTVYEARFWQDNQIREITYGPGAGMRDANLLTGDPS